MWRVHGVLPRSLANGPGERFVVWSQGCPLACPGCFNPDTHATDGGGTRSVGGLLDAVRAQVPGIEGVTLTGGEPLAQPEAVAAFCAGLRGEPAFGDLGIIVLTGFTRTEIDADPARLAAVAAADLVVAGRYNQSQRLASGLRGSANKEYLYRTGRYRGLDLGGVPEVEVHIGGDGTITGTGMADLRGGDW
ncbi:hypothetical protein AA958_28985 [Streptomyces sp. CNQ-509]|nr:hypothetical protein AA958_28985 [Streptomyces sp. CNQ-509]